VCSRSYSSMQSALMRKWNAYRGISVRTGLARLTLLLQYFHVVRLFPRPPIISAPTAARQTFAETVGGVFCIPERSATPGHSGSPKKGSI
jgi:hypothetical protein